MNKLTFFKSAIAHVHTLVLLGVVFFPHLASAQDIKLGGGEPAPITSFLNQDKTWYQDALRAYHGEDLVGADGQLSSLDWQLVYTLYQWRHQTTQNPGVAYVADEEIYPYANGKHLIEIICENEQVWAEVEPELEALGATSISQAGYVMNAWLPVGETNQLAGIVGIKFARPAYRQTRSGITASQGDIALGADVARSLPSGVTGAGITIGTLSDSFATAAAPATTADEDVSTNDLPSDILVLSEFAQPASDEGRAMMQIIHDLAPGASQQFFTAFNGQADFANGIRALDEAGCDIIVDDVFYFSEPFFQNGLVAQAVNEVSANGKAYFSAAGNSGRQSYESFFEPADGASGLSGGALHDFDPGAEVDTFMEINVPVGSSVSFVLQWDEPFFSVSGAPGCQSDLDIFLTGSGAGQFSAIQGAFASNINGDALEIFTFTNDGTIDIDGVPGADSTFNLVIEGLNDAAPNLLKMLFLDRGGFSINEFDTQSGTLVGHANAEKAIAVAAAAFFQTPAFGVNPPQLEAFSSPGGNFLLFADDGTRFVDPLDTEQPRFTAADGGNTTFFGQALGDGDAFPNFFGTSAAAPHAAAVAALLLERAGGSGSLSPVEIISVLSETAIEMETAGFDVESGAGLINALAAINALADEVPLPIVTMDEGNQSWLNANVWDNDLAPSAEFDYVLATVEDRTMRSSPEGGTAGGTADFLGNSLTVPANTRFLLKQQSETASVRSGLGDLILDGGQVSFAPNSSGSPVLDVADFYVSAAPGSSLGIADTIRDGRRAILDGRLTGPGNLLVQLEDGGGALRNGILAISEVDGTGYTGKLTVSGRGAVGNVLLDFDSDVLLLGGAALELIGNGILMVDQLIAFREGKLSDPVNGIVPPGIYSGATLAALGANYVDAGGAIVVSNDLVNIEISISVISDGDSDGFPLILELALGTDSDVADFDNPNRPTISQNADGKIAFTFGRGSEPLAGTVLIVERSTTLLEGSFEEVYRFEFDDESSTLGSGIVEDLLEDQFLITDELQAEGHAFYRLSVSF
ncbi:MAG: S8 family peptidase [Akkermansiaceae bacterium]